MLSKDDYNDVHIGVIALDDKNFTLNKICSEPFLFTLRGIYTCEKITTF